MIQDIAALNGGDRMNSHPFGCLWWVTLTQRQNRHNWRIARWVFGMETTG